MSTTRHPNKKGTAGRDALESLDRPHTVGTDAAGAVHHHSPYGDRVVVVDSDGRIERMFDLSDRKLSAYVAFVDEQRGWDDLRYHETFGDILKEALSA